ncbi:hypothetical protein [Streptomyces sp. NPDC060031]|uniref:hypothetical protein n=1 Tax=Streptomyces sp. NPDC060031 TaxID=3347043 RepID=UPI003681DE9F
MEELVERAVADAVPGDAMLAALRRITRMDASARGSTLVADPAQDRPSPGHPPQAGNVFCG